MQARTHTHTSHLLRSLSNRGPRILAEETWIPGSIACRAGETEHLPGKANTRLGVHAHTQSWAACRWAGKSRDVCGRRGGPAAEAPLGVASSWGAVPAGDRDRPRTRTPGGGRKRPGAGAAGERHGGLCPVQDGGGRRALQGDSALPDQGVPVSSREAGSFISHQRKHDTAQWPFSSPVGAAQLPHTHTPPAPTVVPVLLMAGL